MEHMTATVPVPRLSPTTRRTRAKLIAAIDRILGDLDRSDAARPREVRLVVHPNQAVEVTLLSRYPTITDADVIASEV
jgi:hypothetical protein